MGQGDQEKVLARTMPPWFADSRYGEFSNDRRLAEKEIAMLAAWADSGARPGDPRDLPRPPEFVDGWTIGRPDVEFSIPEPVDVPETGVIPYRYFAVPTNLTEDRWVRSAEIRIGNRAIVHHVIVNVLEPGSTPLPPAGEITRPTGDRSNVAGLVGTAPGMPPMMLPKGMAKLVKAGSVLRFEMHYTPNGKASTDRTKIGLIYADGPPEKRVRTGGAFGFRFVIPPGDPNHEVKSTYTFQQDSQVISFMPHMHLRGKDFEYRVVMPDGTSKVVLSVPRYDFNWQLDYRLKEPLFMPKGSRLDCIAHFDNSPNNKFNPDPTKEVRWGPQTWEEMMIGWFGFYTQDQKQVSQAAP